MITLGILAPKGVNKDIYIGQVSLLLHGNGTNGSTTFVDSSLNNRTVSLAGNAQLSTAQAKFGSASMLFDGTGDYALQDSSITANGYTAECWAYPTILGANLFCIGNGSNSCVVGISGGSWNAFANASGFGAYASATATLNTWQHIAISCDVSSGGTPTHRFFVNGVLAGSVARSVTPDNHVTLATTAGIGRNTASGKYTGYIDDFRYTIGVNRYTASFTPPSTQFPDS